MCVQATTTNSITSTLTSRLLCFTYTTVRSGWPVISSLNRHTVTIHHNGTHYLLRYASLYINMYMLHSKL